MQCCARAAHAIAVCPFVRMSVCLCVCLSQAIVLLDG